MSSISSSPRLTADAVGRIEVERRLLGKVQLVRCGAGPGPSDGRRLGRAPAGLPDARTSGDPRGSSSRTASAPSCAPLHRSLVRQQRLHRGLRCDRIDIIGCDIAGWDIAGWVIAG